MLFKLLKLNKYLFKKLLYKIYYIFMEKYITVLQRKYRKKFLCDIIKKILEPIEKSNNSGEFIRAVTRKALMANTKKLLEYSQNYLKFIDEDIEQFNCQIKNIKKILMLFAFVKFPVVFLCNNTQYNEQIIEYSKTINKYLTKMAENPSHNFFVYLYHVIKLIPLYLDCYCDWEKVDKHINTCQLLLTYHANSKKIHALGKSELDNITKNYINNEQIKLETHVKYMNDNNELSYFINHKDDQNSDDVYEELYWIDVKYKLSKKEPSTNDKLILLDLFNKTIVLLKNCVPNRPDIHKEIEGKIDLQIIKQLIENDVKDDEMFFDLIQYILHKVSLFQAKANDLENASWMNNLKQALVNNVYYKHFIPKFFQELFGKLKKIIDDSNSFKVFINKNNIKI